MVFNLRVIFTGLCAFVENKNKAAETKMCALLVDGTRAVGRAHVEALDGTPLRYHRPFITFPIYSIAPAVQPPTSYGIWFTEKQRITIEYVEDSSSPPRSNDFAIYRMPEYEHPQRYDDTNETHRKSFSWIMNLDSAVPGYAQVNPSALDLAGVPQNVVAQVLIKNGGMRPTLLTRAVWEFEDYITFPQTYRRQFSHGAVLILKNLSSASLVVRTFTNSDERRLNLSPPDSEVEVRISNLCDINPLQWDTGRGPRHDEDVKWFYEILSEDARKKLKDKLDGRFLPTPTPIQFTQGTEGPGSGNCIPAQFPPQDF